MKVGIVVPFSWSFWGAVNEHAELQAEALGRLGIETRTIIGNDPPGTFTRALHPRHGRHGEPPDDVIPVGRSVIVPANGSLPNIVLTTRVLRKAAAACSSEERFDVIHLHEPMTPGICVSALAGAKCPVVATWHAAGELNWHARRRADLGLPDGEDRLPDRRLRAGAAVCVAMAAGAYDVIPNGVLVPPAATSADREHTVVFIGRHDPRKGLPVLLNAWPEIHRRTGARLRVVGRRSARRAAAALAPPGAREGHRRARLSQPGGSHRRAADGRRCWRRRRSAWRASAWCLTRAFACAVPVVSSDIDGYRDVMTDETGLLVPPGDPAALAEAIVTLLEDEPLRQRLGAAARAVAVERYAWDSIAERLAEVYDVVTERRRTERGDGVKRLLRALPRNRWVRVGAVVAALVAAAAAVYWGGPDWSEVGDAFRAVEWEWLAAGDRPQPRSRWWRGPSPGRR